MKRQDEKKKEKLKNEAMEKINKYGEMLDHQRPPLRGKTN
jgi:hypothetical protein